MPFAPRPRRLRRIAVALALAVPCAAGAAPAGPDPVRAAQLREEAVAFEHGEGVPRDGAEAVALYCEAARLGDAESQFRLGWLHAHGTGVERSDALAAFFFGLAAAQGVPQAATMLHAVGEPGDAVPACMRAPAPRVEVRRPVVQDVAPGATDAARPAPAGAPPHIVRLVQRIAPAYLVEPRLALAIIEAESNFDVVALSPKNAMGLMQLIPETAARFNVRNPWDAAQNVRGGLAYLRWLLAYFEGDVQLVAAAYNAGEGAVERHGGVPPYGETRAYVQRILQAVGRTAHPYDASVTPPSPHLPRLRGPGR
ncbi:MAG TPA: transglycosylase SLT domain-containing protein [Albitalea sp.]